MSVATKTKPPPDTYITLSGVDWATFEGLAERTRGGRISYDDGELEIMSPSIYHEGFGDRLRAFVETFCAALNLEYETVGSTTWKAPAVEKGVEADASFYLDPAKIPIVVDLMADEVKDITRFPAPDLVVEIDLRSHAKDRLAIYAAIRAVEVWEFDGETVRILRLGPDGSYAESDRSGWFPVSARDIERIASDDSSGKLARLRSMRDQIDALIERPQGS